MIQVRWRDRAVPLEPTGIAAFGPAAAALVRRLLAEPVPEVRGVAVPDGPFPRVNSRDEISAKSDEQGGLPSDPETAERFARIYIDELKAKAFG